MNLRCLYLLLAAAFSSSVQAEVKLVLPDSIDLLVVNGAQPKIEKVFLSDKSVVLPDGVNQIVFKYEPLVKTNDGMRRVYSDIIVSKFNQTGSTLKFELPNYRRFSQAQKEIKNLKWKLVDEAGDQVELTNDVLRVSGVQIGRNFVQDALEYNQSGGTAAIPVVSYSYEKALTAESKQVGTEDSEAITQLKLWYLKSSEQERKAFRRWMIDQE